MKPSSFFWNVTSKLSHSARSAWIETEPSDFDDELLEVALRKECVD